MKLNYIDLRKELRILRDTMGFRWVALRSVDLSKPCNQCKAKTPDNYDQGHSRCNACLGIGYTYIDKLIQGYKYTQTPEFLIRGASPVGPHGIQTVHYLLQDGANPKYVDWILELELNETTLIPIQPFRITSAFKIEDVATFRSDMGRIEFFNCLVQEQHLSLGKPL